MKGYIQKTATFFANGLVYGLNGIFLIMPLFLSKYFNSVQTGYLLAIPPLLLCIAPLFWGGITDKAKNQNNIMVLLLAAAALSICALRISPKFAFVALALMFYAFFQAPFGSLIDILTIKTSEKYQMNYGIFRIMGSIGYGALAYFITLLKNTDDFVYVYASISILAIVSVLLMLKVYRPESVKKEKKKVGETVQLAKNKELWILIVVLACAFFTWGYYSNFFPTYITETLGLKKSIWGIVAFLAAFSELPFFVYYSKIFKRFTIREILFVSSLAMVIRWIVFATVTNAAVLIVVGFVTGLFITVITYCATFYIVTVIAPDYVNRAQSLLYAFGTGVPKMLAGCIGGYMTYYLSEPVSFVICAIISMIGLILPMICKNTAYSIDEKISLARFGKLNQE